MLFGEEDRVVGHGCVVDEGRRCRIWLTEVARSFLADDSVLCYLFDFPYPWVNALVERPICSFTLGANSGMLPKRVVTRQGFQLVYL